MDEPRYRRSTGSPRGQARRRELLERVCDDLAENGLVDFSLRRAARAAGTTHKVLLYHFDGVDDLLIQAVRALRQRRVERGLAAAAAAGTLVDRVRAMWPVLTSGEAWVLDQAIGLTVYDSQRYAELGRGASDLYLPVLASMCPPDWAAERKQEVAELILAALRGFLIRRVTGDPAGVEAGLRALTRALRHEEEAG